MLQRRSARRAPADGALAEVPPEVDKVLPITWVHVPKCGSSFVNTLIHLPGVCQPALPEDLYVAKSTFGSYFLGNFSSSWDTAHNCPGLELRIGHWGIGKESSNYYAEREGRFMIMLRSPEQRLMSAYTDMITMSHQQPDQISATWFSWGGWPFAELPSLPVFSAYAGGCVVRMLTRDGLPCGGAGGPPSRAEIDLAKQRLRTGFAFVGLTDQWSLSMCLFDAMFKTGCHAIQFSDNRPGPDKRRGSEYNEERLEGVKDPFDTEVFEEAVRIFEAGLERYNVSEASCQPCWQAAGISLASFNDRVFYEDEQ